ncbi:MAG: BREX system P-loop protein BrxC, partial [Lachnospiraceae bacterium]|nr:BREX system P-loop protein BrxC [Lachnospiraceae bacterium]
MPYRDIPQLPDLRKKFMDAYSKVLESALAPVMQSIEAAKDRVVEVVDAKAYATEKRQKYIELFLEISDGAGTCNNVSVLRSYADKAEALKIRLLNEMDAMDAEMIRKRAEEEEKKRTPDGGSVDIVVKVPIKKTKNVTIKNITHTSSWRIESAEDVEKCVNQLRKSLLEELDGNDIVNVEF